MSNIKLQDLSLEDKVVMLKQRFYQLSNAEVSQYLAASNGDYHAAVGLLQQCLGLDLDQQVTTHSCNQPVLTS